jgi:hypothetical protein
MQRNHHSVMGMESNPTDHKAVAASIFITVAIYGVSSLAALVKIADQTTGFPCLLRVPSIPACSSEQEGRYLSVKDIWDRTYMDTMRMQRSSGSGLGSHHEWRKPPLAA